MKIAQAASSETFSKYGTAPNQRRTGVTPDKPEGNLDGELNVVDFAGGWECVYRPLDDEVAERIAAFVYRAVCNGSHIGYSQDATRKGLFDALEKLGSSDPLDVLTLVNVDCATLMGGAIWHAGVRNGVTKEQLRSLCTWEMEDVLAKTGAFSKLASRELCQEGKGIRRGDILWRTGHTACSLDTDRSEPRLVLSDEGLYFYDNAGDRIGAYPADAAGLLRGNGIRTVQMSGNAWYAYSTEGEAVYELVKDATYLVTFAQRNAKKGDNAVWLVSTHNYSSISPLLEAKYTVAVVDGLTLTIVRGVRYGRVTITRLS